MKRWFHYPVLALVLAGLTAAQEPLQQLKSRVENARPDDGVRLCMEISQLQLHNADSFYEAGEGERARTAVQDIVHYSEKARDLATQSHKHLKNVEITVRKMSDRLRDIKHTLAFEDQQPVEDAVRRLEDVRTSLLKEMFRKEKK